MYDGFGSFHINATIGAVNVNAWHPRIIDVVRERRLSTVQLSGWDQPDLTPLLPLRDQVDAIGFYYSPKGLDVSCLSEFTRLKRLYIGDAIGDIDFSRLTRLKSLAVTADKPRFGNLELATGLERLQLTDCGLKDLTPLAKISSLRALFVSEAPLRSLAGIEHLTGLRQLGMSQVPLASLDGLQSATRLSSVIFGFVNRLESIAELTAVPNLTHLDITPPRKVRDFARIGELTQLEHLEIDGKIADAQMLALLVNLRSLRMEDVGTLESLRFLEGMAELREFNFFGNSKVTDGDISILLRLPKLRYGFRRAARHYTPSAESIRDAISSRLRFQTLAPRTPGFTLLRNTKRTWDTGAFENETAVDWMYDLQETNDLSLIESTIDRALFFDPPEEVSADAAERAVAAAATLARLRGWKPLDSPHAEIVVEWVQAHPIGPPAELIAKARTALGRVTTEPSELLEMWEEDGAVHEWCNAVGAVADQLRVPDE